jgi:tetratricopeptide (TPR) repeat protein
MAYQTSQEAIEIAEESGDIYSKACAYGAHGPSCFFKGYFQEAELNLLIAMDFCERIRYWNMEINNLLLLVMVYLEMKDIEAAEMHCIRAIELADKTDAQPSTLILIKIYIELVRLIKGQANIDLEMIYSLSAENKLRVYEGWIRRLIGKIILNLDNSKFSDAESWIESAIKEDRRNKATWNLGMDYAVYAEMFKRRDDQAKAREKLRNAIEILDNCGADGWVEKYSEELERLQ